MRQIGYRFEAGRLGGIGSCGRELCCSSWLTDFRAVSTSAARYQQLSLNPAKLAGQCGKLKCCLNYELDQYVEALKDFPSVHTRLQLAKGTASHFKTDIFKRIMFFSYDEHRSESPFPLTIEAVKEIIERNKKGIAVEDVEEFMHEDVVVEETDFAQVVGQDSLTRFDRKKGRSSNQRGGKNRGGGGRRDDSRAPQRQDAPGGARPQQAERRGGNDRRNSPRPQQNNAANPGNAERPPQQPRPDNKNQQRPPQNPRPPQQQRPPRPKGEGGNDQPRQPRQQRPPRPPRPPRENRGDGNKGNTPPPQKPQE